MLKVATPTLRQERPHKSKIMILLRREATSDGESYLPPKVQLLLALCRAYGSTHPPR
jgi:hypothetical protein